MRTTQHGIKSNSSLIAKTWDLLLEEVKNNIFHSIFKDKIGKYFPEKCLCKLCLTYIKNIGYILFLLNIS